jgi:transcriptional regulator with XRE-family HTH domain
MFPEKIKITDELIQLIIDTRKAHNLTAYQLSEKIGKNKSWLPNIENRRTKNISRNDLILLFKDFAKDKNMEAEEFVIKYLSPTATVELNDNVSVPNHYLQNSMGIYSPDHDMLHISDEERIKRMEYYIQDKPYEVDLMHLKKNLKDLSDTIIDEFSYCETPDDRRNMIKLVKTMRVNFQGEFAYTQKLYQFPLFHGDAETCFGNTMGKDYLQKTNNNIESFSAKQKLLYSYAEICSEMNYDEGTYNPYIDLTSINENTDVETLEQNLFGYESFIYELHEYIKSAKNEALINQHPCNIDCIKLFEHIISSINSFITKAKLDYHFEYTMPTQDADVDELIKKCLELNTITYGIKQAIRNKKQ